MAASATMRPLPCAVFVLTPLCANSCGSSQRTIAARQTNRDYNRLCGSAAYVDGRATEIQEMNMSKIYKTAAAAAMAPKAPIRLAHADLFRSQQRPEQHRSTLWTHTFGSGAADVRLDEPSRTSVAAFRSLLERQVEGSD